MKVTLYRPDPPDSDAPWVLDAGEGYDPKLLRPPADVIARIEGQNGEVEAELDDTGDWTFPDA